MEKLKLHTPDLVTENIRKLSELFPNCVTEARDEHGNLTRSVDFDQLRQELADRVVEGPRERYHLDWPGKREGILAANAPIAKTLRPCREESVGFDTTKNLFIEGDNLDALKLLQEAYLGKVKLIYIDPPYNTGNDFIYDDDFSEDTGAYFIRSNQADDAGNRMVANTEANGRFHSDWLTMLYPRLKLARALLRDDGVIFISIDDREVANLRRVCDEIFGEQNFVANIVWQKKYAVSNDDPGIAAMHDHIVAYRKTDLFTRKLLPRTDKQLVRYKNEDNDPRGPWSSDNYVSNKSRSERPTLWYAIKHPKTGEDVWPKEDAVWRYSKENHERMEREDRLYWGPDQSYEKPRLKRFLFEVQEGTVPSTWWDFEEVGHNDEGQKETGKLLGKKIFSTPKPLRLLKRIIQLAAEGDDICLDFFGGSGATAHAVMAFNAEDSGRRRQITVQLPERCDENTEAFKAGYRTIAEITKERIRRAGKAIKTESALSAPDLDVGFRVLKIDSSNMKDVYYAPDESRQKDLLAQVDNIKAGRTPEDLLFQVLVDWGVDLALPVAQEGVGGKTFYFVDGNALAACFDQNITDDLVKEIAKRKPLRAVFRDSSYGSDSVKINVEQIFKLLSPSTEIRSL
jgi:adenine-specific DNA-methyltransferase